MKGHAIIGFNHGVLGLAENPALGPGFFRQNTSGYALGVLTPKASPSGWVFSQAQHPMIKTYNIDYPGSTRSLNWLKSIFLKDKDILILQSQYHGCWCPVDARSQGISRHGIDLNSQNIPPEGLTVWRVKS